MPEEAMYSLEFLEGQWRLQSSENFDTWLKRVGVGLFARKAAEWVPTVEDWALQDDQLVRFKIICPGKTHHATIPLREWFTEDTMDGRQCQSYVWVEDGKLYHRQRTHSSAELETVIVREVIQDQMICTFMLEDHISRRYFTRER